MVKIRRVPKQYKNFLLLLLCLLPACSTLPTVLQIEKLPSTKQCWQQTATEFGLTDAAVSLVLNQKVEAYKSLVEESLMHREIAIAMINKLQDEAKLNRKAALQGHDLDMLNKGLMAHLELRSKLYDVAYAQSCWDNPKKGNYQKLGMQPLSFENQLKGSMLSLSAALLLYDNYLLMSSLFEDNTKLRHFLNQQDPAYHKGRNALKKLSKSYHSARKLRRVKRAIKFYHQALKNIPPELLQDEDFIYLNTLIQQSQSYNIMKKNSLLGNIAKRLTFMTRISKDDFLALESEGISLFSQVFGNAVGLVEARKGKLYRDKEVLEKVTNRLQAGDILLEKTPFRLTDKLIPGHWGHAAIWVGTEAELKALGIWQHPVVIPYQDKIRKGVSIVEALRSGVQMNSVAHFLNIDDLAILRSPNPSKNIKIQHILLALKQIGKGYDFNFDVETTDKIVCSELIYTVYTDMSWPTEKALGRYTISPDHVANKALDGSLTLITLYHDGKEITQQPLTFMAKLMGGHVRSNTFESAKLGF